MKTRNLGSITEVRVSAREVSTFNSQWPCAGIPERACWFQFDRNDLCDLSPHLMGDRFDGDGNALNALSQDAQAYGKANPAP